MLHEGPNLHVRVFSIDIWFCQLISILDEDSSYGEYVAAKHLSKRIFQVTLFSYFFLKKEKNGHKQLLKIIILGLQLLSCLRYPLLGNKHICTKPTGRHFSKVN